MVSKLNPKSMPVTVEVALAGDTIVTDCAMPPLSSIAVHEDVLLGPSLSAGFSPPTRLVTATTPPPLPAVRNVCTGTQVAHPAPPARAERTVPLTSRTITCWPALLPLDEMV